MMRWNVEGADASTGQDRLVTVEADDLRQAEVAARMKGLLVSAVHPVKVLSPADKLEQMMAGKLDASTVTTTRMVEDMTDAASDAMRNVEPAPPTVEYRNPRGLNVQFADNGARRSYVHLRIAGFALAIFASLSYLTGAINLALAAMALSERTYFGNFASILTAIVAVLMAGSPLLYGAILHAASAGCFALRDIARSISTRSA